MYRLLKCLTLQPNAAAPIASDSDDSHFSPPLSQAGFSRPKLVRDCLQEIREP